LHRIHLHRLALVFPIVVFPAIPALGADPPAAAALKEKGLSRSGRYFVVEGEKAVLDKWKETRASLNEHLATADRRQGEEQAASDSARLDERRAELQSRLDEMNQQINEQGFQQQAQGGFGQAGGGLGGPGGNRQGGFGQGGFGQSSALSQMIAQRNMIRMNLNEIASAQKALKSPSTADAKARQAEDVASRDAAKKSLAEFRKSVDEILKQYNELGSDASVKSAFQALEREKLTGVKLGPSADFKNVVKSLETAEKKILGRASASTARKKTRSRR